MGNELKDLLTEYDAQCKSNDSDVGVANCCCPSKKAGDCADMCNCCSGICALSCCDLCCDTRKRRR